MTTFLDPTNFLHKPTFQTNLSMFCWPCPTKKKGLTPPTRWNKSLMRTIAWYPVGSFLSHLSMILSVRNMESTFAWPLERQLVSWMKINMYIYIYHKYFVLLFTNYKWIWSKKTQKIMWLTIHVLCFIYHAMTCLVTVSGCCFQTKLYIRRIKIQNHPT